MNLEAPDLLANSRRSGASSCLRAVPVGWNRRVHARRRHGAWTRAAGRMARPRSGGASGPVGPP